MEGKRFGGRRRQTKHQHELSASVSSSERGDDNHGNNEKSTTRLTIWFMRLVVRNFHCYYLSDGSY